MILGGLTFDLVMSIFPAMHTIYEWLACCESGINTSISCGESNHVAKRSVVSERISL